MESDPRQYGRAGKLFRVTTALGRQESIAMLLSLSDAWCNEPVNGFFTALGGEFEFDDDIDEGTMFYCDTPYGWCLGTMSYDENGDITFTSNDPALPDIEGKATFESPTWRVHDFEMVMGGQFPPLVGRSAGITVGAVVGQVYPGAAPVVPPKPTLKTMPDGTVPVQLPATPNNSVDALPTPEVASGIKTPKTASDDATASSVKLPKKKAAKPVVDQALDEGYIPVSIESPTGLVRPTLQSPTQLLAYFVACTTFDVDLAVNEMHDFMDNKETFYTRLWPAWADPVTTRPVVKTVAPAAAPLIA